MYVGTSQSWAAQNGDLIPHIYKIEISRKTSLKTNKLVNMLIIPDLVVQIDLCCLW